MVDKDEWVGIGIVGMVVITVVEAGIGIVVVALVARGAPQTASEYPRSESAGASGSRGRGRGGEVIYRRLAGGALLALERVKGDVFTA